MRWIRGRGHTLFRWESLLNTPLFVGFPGFGSNRSPEALLHLGRRQVRVSLGDLALPDTAFPHLTVQCQTDVEEVLVEALAWRGVAAERGAELVGLRPDPGLVLVTLRSLAGTQEARFRFLAACDCRAGRARTLPGIGWHILPEHSATARTLARQWDVPLFLSVAELPAARGQFRPSFQMPRDAN